MKLYVIGTLSFFLFLVAFDQSLDHSLALSILSDHWITFINIFGDSIPIYCDFISVPLKTIHQGDKKRSLQFQILGLSFGVYTLL